MTTGDEWRNKLISEIFDALAGMSLRQLARAHKAIRHVADTKNERAI